MATPHCWATIPAFSTNCTPITHPSMYSIAWPTDFAGRNHSAQRTELAVHDLRAHVNSRGAASKQATLISHVQNAAVRQDGQRGGAVHRDDDGERDFPRAMLFHSCVTGFDVRSLREFVVTLDRMMPGAAAFVLAAPGSQGVLWVSSLALVATAGSDPIFAQSKVCKQVCFCKSKGAPSHTFAWDDFARKSTLAGYLEWPWCHLVDKVFVFALPPPLFPLGFRPLSHTLFGGHTPPVLPTPSVMHMSCPMRSVCTCFSRLAAPRHVVCL